MQDLTQGSITRHLIKMSIPVAVGLFIQVLYFLVDLYFVGRISGEAIAAVSSAGTLFFLLMGLTQVLNIGCAALVSHAVGEKNQAKANHIFNQAVSLGLWATLVCGVLGYGLGNHFFDVLAANSATKQLSVSYFYWFLPSLLIQFLMTALVAGLRGTGIVKPAMAISMLGVVVNIILSPILIEGLWAIPPLGVVGAGLASSIAAFVSLVFLVRYFKVETRYLSVSFTDLRLDLPVVRQILKVGLPSGGEFILTFVYMSIIYWALSGFTASAQAGFGIGMRIMQSLFLPVMAVAFAAPAIIGQNVGAKNKARVHETYRSTVRVTCLLMGVLMVFCLTVPQIFVSSFSDDQQVLNVAKGFLALVAFNFIPAGYVYTVSGVFQGLGNTLPSLYSSMTRIAFFALPVIFLVLSANLELNYIWYFSIFSVYVQAIVSFVLMRMALKQLTFDE